ncbi:glycoside hydrolase family 3 protein [Lanmaoa asiatica]|nr:glycoside hydrolase family 3 protein [Lanmaoa asiatica]
MDRILFASALAVGAAVVSGFPNCATPPLSDNAISLLPVSLVSGLPAYQWWSEALHGVANSPGVDFSSSGEFSYATSFPQPILMGAAFDDALIESVGRIVGTEGRAFNNYGRAGLDFWTPNINLFQGSSMGTLVIGLQGGLDPYPYYKVVATCKHYAGYDLEDWEGNYRYGFNAVITTQDLSEYYLPSLQSCYRDVKVGAAMQVTLGNTYLLQDILRASGASHKTAGQYLWFLSITTPATPQQAVADALMAGTDIDCGTFYSEWLPTAYNESLITETQLRTALTHQYASLVRLGYFDPVEWQPYRTYNWSNVNTPEAQQLAYQAAVEGIVLLKNDGTLPLSTSVKSIALIGPWANATTQMQGNYEGIAPYLISPLMGAIQDGYKLQWQPAHEADVVIYAGGIDVTIEAEANDRLTITWPGNQLELIAELQGVGKPLVVVQFGGGQLDDTTLKGNASVDALVWAGYPGQSGGQALFDILRGKVAPAGRLPVTQYPADYVYEIPMTDMNLRPSATSPGRTYKWYDGIPVYSFGYGEHYTTFNYRWSKAPASTYNIQELVDAGQGATHIDTAAFDTLAIDVTNTGKVANTDPTPYPNKSLVSYTRLHSIIPGSTSTAVLPITLGALARADTYGNFWLYPGTYTLALDTAGTLTYEFTLIGNAAQLTYFPKNLHDPGETIGTFYFDALNNMVDL